jgi:hypothetical protein
MSALHLPLSPSRHGEICAPAYLRPLLFKKIWRAWRSDRCPKNYSPLPEYLNVEYSVMPHK